MTRGRALAALAAVVVIVNLSACTVDRRTGPAPSPPAVPASPTVTPPSSPTTSDPPPPVPPDAAHRVWSQLSQQQRIAQLFMVGTQATGVDSAVTALIATGAVGSVFLAGNSTLPVTTTAAMVAAMQKQAGAVQLFVATDQEGGTVQRLQGPNFSDIPSALVQGRSTPTAERAAAATWGRQLAAAGVNLDLAPVMDTVPSAAFAPNNPPIGALDREFGYTPAVVSAAGTAFVQGLTDAGVDSTIKHFPGLGRVVQNTDTHAGVTDPTTTRADTYLAPFAAAVNAGSPFVMMSSAIYSQIDPSNPAVFSSIMVSGVLRGDLHFAGVVISDDLGAAEEVAKYPVGDRAVRFVAAGGDMVLTVSAGQIAPMAAAVLARCLADSAFAAQVDAAALRVLEAKAARGLLS